MSLMQKEALQIPHVVALQLESHAFILPDIVKAIKEKNPQMVLTVGRGSSDHATALAKYLFETKCHILTASSAPSVQTIYQSPLNLQEALVVAVSQSGESSDICAVLESAKAQGAMTLAIVNKPLSPLAKIADYVIPICAGEERSVAATKSFVATATTLIHLVALLSEDQDLLAKLKILPDRLGEAAHLSWSKAAEFFAEQSSALVLARGYGFPIALESALKLKETCKMHAEAFSSAEVLHGPFALINEDFPLLVYGQADESLSGLTDILNKLFHLNTRTYLALAKDKITPEIRKQAGEILQLPESLHPICDPLVALQVFYIMAEQCAKWRGIDPDRPDNLNKVTDTL